MESKGSNGLPNPDPPSNFPFISSRLRTWVIRLCLLGFLINCVGWLMFRSGPNIYLDRLQARLFPRTPDPLDREIFVQYKYTCDLHDPDEDPLPSIRTEFTGRGTIVYGWPSTGGVWVKHDCYGVEMGFLGLDRFNGSDTQRDSDPEAEDAFCQRMEYIGARFYETEYEYNKKQSWPGDERPQLWVGWPRDVPEGGAWALWLSDIETARMGVSRVRNAFTMQERCEAIKMLGGRFFENWADVLRSEPEESKDMDTDTEL